MRRRARFAVDQRLRSGGPARASGDARDGIGGWAHVGGEAVDAEGTSGLGHIDPIRHRVRPVDPPYGWGGYSGRRSIIPRVRLGHPEVRGALARAVVTRVVRRHVNEIRFCYEQELVQRPDLAGRITIAFIVSATGAVQTATVMSSTLSNARVEGCIAQAARRWTFPPPSRGMAAVDMPFVLDSTES